MQLSSGSLRGGQSLFKIPLNKPAYGAERGIYLTFGDTGVIISVCKANLRHQMCPERLPEEHQTNVPFVRRRHLWCVGPSTRGVTAPQQVNFVVCRAQLFPKFSRRFIPS